MARNFLFFFPKRIWHILIILLCCIDSLQLQGTACTSPMTQIVDRSSGNISSHNATESNLYSSNARCTWVIKVPLGHVIKLTFLTFQLEPDPSGCRNDSVTVHNGQSPTGDVLGKFCGFTRPPVIVSLEQFMWVSFRSNEYGNFEGFRAIFTVVKIGVSCSARNSHEMNNNILLRDSSGDLSGPLDGTSSEDVADGLQCTWRVAVPKGFGIKFSFAKPLFGSNQNDSLLEIHRGFLHASTLVARIQGLEGTRLLSNIYMPTNHMWVRLKMPNGPSMKETHLAANYQALHKDVKTCSYVNYVHENENIRLEGTTGEISSPNYPDAYSGTIECIWQIKVPLGFKVKLTFTAFDSHVCTADNLELRDGSSSSAPLMGRFCGPHLPPDLYTSGRSMWLKFTVRSSASFKGFRARYSAVTTAEGACSQLNTVEMNTNIWKNSSSGRFVTPRYPAKYPSDATCVWRIVVPREFRIKLQFTHFDLEEHDCKYDFVEVRDGLRLDSPLIGGRLLCGRIHDDTAYYSSGPRMLVSFASDPSEQFIGFEAFYSVVLPELDKCSPVNTFGENNNIHVSGGSGFISSPNFPGLFPNNIQCTWTVTVPPGYRIIYQVSFFHLESSCSVEYLDVRDGASSSSPHHDRYCGEKEPFHVLSTGRSLWIRFKTNNYLRFVGFNSSFTATPTGPNACSRENFYFTNNNIRLNATSGQLSSPEFPLPYSRESECTWILEARAGYRIKLTFNVVDLPTPCVNHYIQVCEGRYNCRDNAYIICGNGHRVTTQERVYSRGQFLWVRFKANSNTGNRFSGFKATYQQLSAGVCSHSYSPTWNQNLWLTQSLSGTITSPDFPDAISQPIRCYWKISVPSGRTVKLFFEFFRLPPSCNESCIRIYDGLDPSKPLIAQLSGGRDPPTVFSSGRSLLMQFEASSSLKNSGDYKFKAFYLGVKTSVAAVSSSTRTQMTSVIIGVIIAVIVLLGSVTLVCTLRKARRCPARAAERHNSSLSRVSSFHETSSPHVVTLQLRRLPEVQIPDPSPEVTTVDNIPELPMINDLPDLNVVEEHPPTYEEAVLSDSDSQETISRSGFDDEPEVEVEREDDGSVGEVRDGRLDGLGLDNLGFAGSMLQLNDQPPAYDTLFHDT